MAHYKRGKSRVQSSPHRSNRSLLYSWMSHNPRWWDILHHTRPRRRREAELARAILTGRIDPDAAAWPVGRNAPTIYYW